MTSWRPPRTLQYFRRNVIERWARIMRDKELLSALAERNTAIRLAIDAQMAVSRLQEQIGKLEELATAKPVERALVELSAELLRLREMLGNTQINGREGANHLKRRQLDAVEVAYKRLMLEIDSHRKGIEGIRTSLMENDTMLGTETNATKVVS